MIIRNVFRAANQHIRMISKGLCDMSNEAENSVLITGINSIFKCIQIEKQLF